MGLKSWLKNSGFTNNSEKIEYNNVTKSNGSPSTVDASVCKVPDTVVDEWDKFSLSSGNGYPPNFEYQLANGWISRHRYMGEWKMGCDYWGLMLINGDKKIEYFKNEVVNQGTGADANGYLKLSECGRYCDISTIKGNFIIDFKEMKMTCLRYDVRVDVDGKSITVSDQPVSASMNGPIYLREMQKYVTYPFVPVGEFKDSINSYIDLRKIQISDLWMKTKKCRRERASVMNMWFAFGLYVVMTLDFSGID